MRHFTILILCLFLASPLFGQEMPEAEKPGEETKALAKGEKRLDTLFQDATVRARVELDGDVWFRFGYASEKEALAKVEGKRIMGYLLPDLEEGAYLIPVLVHEKSIYATVTATPGWARNIVRQLDQIETFLDTDSVRELLEEISRELDIDDWDVDDLEDLFEKRGRPFRNKKAEKKEEEVRIRELKPERVEEKKAEEKKIERKKVEKKK